MAVQVECAVLNFLKLKLKDTSYSCCRESSILTSLSSVPQPSSELPLYPVYTVRCLLSSIFIISQATPSRCHNTYNRHPKQSHCKCSLQNWPNALGNHKFLPRQKQRRSKDLRPFPSAPFTYFPLNVSRILFSSYCNTIVCTAYP